jgi:hypothetical protein
MSVTITLDNSANSAEANPPGYSQWVGGQEHGDPAGVKVDKEDTACALKIDGSPPYLATWYYNYGWYSGANLEGPFTDGQVIQLKKVVAAR